MEIYTIGFSKKNLREFIRRIQSVGVKRVLDIRLNNTSQLAGYSKKDDLEYILELVNIQYQHLKSPPYISLFILFYQKSECFGFFCLKEWETGVRPILKRPDGTIIEITPAKAGCSRQRSEIQTAAQRLRDTPAVVLSDTELRCPASTNIKKEWTKPPEIGKGQAPSLPHLILSYSSL